MLRNLSVDADREEVSALMSRFGEVTSLELPRGKRFGFVTFTDASSVRAALVSSEGS